LVIVDELHMIGSGPRGAILEEALTKLVPTQTGLVGLSATIGNLAAVASFLRAESYIGDFRARPLNEYVRCSGMN
jgi:replicative superfamily II helicase